MSEYTLDDYKKALIAANEAGDSEAEAILAKKIMEVEGAPDAAGPVDAEERGIVGQQARGLARGVIGNLGMIGDIQNWTSERLKAAGLPDSVASLVAGGLLQNAPTSETIKTVAEGATGLDLDPLSENEGRAGELIGASIFPGGGARGVAMNVLGGAGAAAGGALTGNSVAGELIGGLAPTGIHGAASMAAKGIIRGGKEGAWQMRKNIGALERMGIEPGLAATSPRSFTQGLGNVLKSVPGGGAPLRRQGDDVAKKLAGKLREAVETGGSLSDEAAGIVISDSVGKAIIKRRRDAGKAFAAVREKVPNQQKVSIAQYKKAVQELIEEGGGPSARRFLKQLGLNPKAGLNPSKYIEGRSKDFIMPDFQLNEKFPKAGSFLKELPDEITFEEAENLRQALGKQLNSISPFDPKGATKIPGVRRLYGKLLDDIGGSLNDDAAEAWSAARSKYAEETKIIDNVLRPLIRDGKASPENVFRSLTSGKLKNVTAMRETFRGMSPDERRVVSKVFFANLGKMDENGNLIDDFVVERFFNNGKQIFKKNEAVDILFEGNEQLGRDIRKIFNAAERVTERSRVLANPSGTAGQGLSAAVIYSALGQIGTGAILTGTTAGGLSTLAAGAVGANVLSRLVTNPAVARWAARATTITTPAELAGHIARLNQVAKANPEMAAEIQMLATAISQSVAEAENADAETEVR